MILTERAVILKASTVECLKIYQRQISDFTKGWGNMGLAQKLSQ